MASPVEQLVAVATKRQDAVEEELRDLRVQVTELRLSQARSEGAALVWGRVFPILSLFISTAALTWSILRG